MDRIRITERKLIFGPHSIWISEIVEIRVVTQWWVPKVGPKILFTSFLLTVLFYYFDSVNLRNLVRQTSWHQPASPPVSHFFLGLILYMPFLYGVLERMRYVRHALHVDVVDGSYELFSSIDESAVREIAHLIYFRMLKN
jgi:hypothetical protein